MKSYLIHQKIRALVNQYDIYDSNEAGEAGDLVGFAQQKRFAFKEKFTVYSDSSKQKVSFEVQARQVMDFGARYDVTDAKGAVLGTLGKDFKSSLLRSTWHIFAPGKEKTPLLVIQERSQPLAILRRIWGLLPIIGDFTFFLKYHFDFINPQTQDIDATYNKTTTLYDHYQLNILGGVAEQTDPRVLISLGILMDALQDR